MTPRLYVRHWHRSSVYNDIVTNVPSAVMSDAAVLQRLVKYVSEGLRYTDVIQGHQPYREISDAICRNIRDNGLQEGLLVFDWVIRTPGMERNEPDEETSIAQLILDIEDIIRMSEQEPQP